MLRYWSAVMRSSSPALRALPVSVSKHFNKCPGWPSSAMTKSCRHQSGGSVFGPCPDGRVEGREQEGDRDAVGRWS